MTAPTQRRRRPPLGPSQRYPTLATDGRVLFHVDGRVVELAGMGPLEVAATARQLAGVECVVWVHPNAHDVWKLPRRPDDAHASRFGRGRVVGRGGWLVLDDAPPVHMAFPLYLGEFTGAATPLDLAIAVEGWREAVGMAFVFSGPSTLHKLIASMAQVPASSPEPELPGYAPCAWATPANTWGVASLDALAARRFVRVFDRAGSYLSAWRGITLPIGEWEHLGALRAEPAPEARRQCGYWRVDPDALPTGHGLFDPWRRHGDEPGPRWITTPLLQLAVDLADEPVPVLEAWVATDRTRALDKPAERIAAARTSLAGEDDPAAAVALEALKTAYAGATAWFEFGPTPPDPLARPAWRRSIIDRYAANTFRALAKATPGPFALAEIDAALFAVDGPDDLPDGLRVDGLGSWKPKGRPVPMDEARAAYDEGGPRAVVALAELEP